MEARECPNTQVQAEHLTAACGHHFEDVFSIAGQVVGKSSDTKSAFRQLWWK